MQPAAYTILLAKTSSLHQMQLQITNIWLMHRGQRQRYRCISTIYQCRNITVFDPFGTPYVLLLTVKNGSSVAFFSVCASVVLYIVFVLLMHREV